MGLEVDEIDDTGGRVADGGVLASDGGTKVDGAGAGVEGAVEDADAEDMFNDGAAVLFGSRSCSEGS